MTPGTISSSLKAAAITAAKSLVFFLGLALFLVLVAVGTEGGSKWTMQRLLTIASDNSPYGFAIEDMQGTLVDEMVFTNFSVIADDASGFSTTMGNLVLNWNPLALFDKSVHIRDLQIRQLVFDQGQGAAASDESLAVDDLLEMLFASPYSLQIDQSAINNITLRAAQNTRLARINLSGSLSQAGLEISALLDQDEANGFSTRLHLDPEGYALEGALTWRAMLAGNAANGSMNLSGTLEEIILQHALNAPALVKSSGLVTTGIFSTSPVAMDLRHEFSGLNGAGLALPALEKVQNLGGVITTRGTIEQVEVSGELEAGIVDFGLLVAGLEVIYQAGQVEIRRLDLDSEKLTLAASGSYTLASQNTAGSSLSLNWTLDNFTDGDLLQNLALVSVEGNGSVNIDITDTLVTAALSINDLAGEINGFPLTGSGDLLIANNQLEQLNIDLLAGGNSLALNGSISPALDLDWQLQAPALNRLLFTLDGALAGEGALSGTIDLPRINGALSGASISYRDESVQLQLASVEAQASYDGTDNQLELNFANLVWGEGSGALSFPQGLLALSGTLPEHDLSVEVQSTLFTLQASAAGGLEADIWNGVISAMGLQSDYGDWQLSRAVEIVASRQQASFSEHCWTTSSFSLCGQANWENVVGLSGEVVIDNFPLSYINNRALVASAGLDDISAVLATRPPGLEKLLADYAIALPANGFIDGRTDVASSFSGLGGPWADTRLGFVLSPRDLLLGVVIPATEDDESQNPKVESYGLDEVQLDLTRENGQWSLASAFQVYVPESGGLDFQGAFSGKATLDDNENVNGQFDLDFSNIAWLEALVPNLLNPAGELQANGEIGGDLTRPLLRFDSSLSNGSFELPEYGLLLRDINLALHSEQDNLITIAGEAASGDGQVSIDSVLTTPFIDSRTLLLEVKGENFQIINSPGTLVTVNPDLTINYVNNVLDISGALLMPQFDLDISNNMALVGNGSVGVSRDVVVFNIPPELEASVEANNEGLLGRIPVTGSVMLGLGDQVRFRGFGLDLNLTGNLMLEQSIDRPLLAYGELAIPSGNYSMYGQRLLIENGKLLFLGNPLNPAVDLRALRNTSNAQVGLQMHGTINRLQAQLFSTPSMPESEILALLVTGRSFQNIGNQDGDNMLGAIANLGLEKGQGLTNSVRNGLGLDTVDISTSDDYRDSALGLGKYIRPNLFMRYDIGLFDRENSLTLEYILTERLKMEVETGVSQSVDLTYTVEK